MFDLILSRGESGVQRIGNNIVITKPYISQAGNRYFNAIRFFEGAIVKESVGRGYLHTFINGISIYSKDGKLLAHRSYHKQTYSTYFIQNEVLNMVEILLETDSLTFDRSQLKSIAY